MKILVLSDSHSSISFMRECVKNTMPDVIIHLGDYYDDAEVIAEENRNLRFYHVPGNCDHYRMLTPAPEIILPQIDGLRFYLTHGHRHNVKIYLEKLISDAAKEHVDAVLFGHTHEPYCEIVNGMLVMNPGSCGSFGGTAGIILTGNGRILESKIISQADWSVTT